MFGENGERDRLRAGIPLSTVITSIGFCPPKSRSTAYRPVDLLRACFSPVGSAGGAPHPYDPAKNKYFHSKEMMIMKNETVRIRVRLTDYLNLFSDEQHKNGK
jgi:hypothetical protein